MLLGAYIALLIGLVLNAPGALWHPENRSFIVVVGVIGLWRYSWGMLHFLRSLWYRRVTFKHRRKLVDRLLVRAEAAGDAVRVPEVWIVVTSFRIRAEPAAAVFEAALREVIRYGAPATLVASIVEMGDQRLGGGGVGPVPPPP